MMPSIVRVLAALVCLTGTAAAQTWKPNKPVTVIVPFGAGGALDVTARYTAEVVAAALGMAVVVQNRPGASGFVGTSAALSAPKDGYTLLFQRTDYFENAISSGQVRTRLSDWRPYFVVTSGGQRAGLFVHNTAPASVRATLDRIWQNAIPRSAKLRAFASTPGMEFTPIYGEAATGQTAAAPEVNPSPPPPAVAAPSRPPAAPAESPPSAVPPNDGSRVALVIGNGRYRHAAVLTNPANDAADIAATLRKLGFDVVEGRDLDKRAMEDKAREFGRKLEKASLALFFYAGHGLQVGGKNYLAPIDAKLERPGDLSFETIDVAQILAQMEAEQRVNLVFLDACRDNPLARTLARSLGTRSAVVGRGLATIQSAVGTMIAYATQPDNVALDGDGRNSPFTTALLKHIATPGLEISSLMKRVRAEVIAATRRKQVPWDHSSLVGDVVLAR
jgi:hypothetical protein